MDKPQILIVEDDTAFGNILRKWFERNGYGVRLCTRMTQALETLGATTFKLVMTDLRLPDGDGIMLLTWIKEQHIKTPVIIMTGYAEIQSAVSAMKIGAFDYLEKPINPSLLKEKVDAALQPQETDGATSPQKPDRAAHRKSQPVAHPNIVYGKSPRAQEMFEHIRIVAPTKMAVLITGESGTGKEYAARMIHAQSRRHDRPFIALDCGSLSRELAPSELFGHLKGSFTSAIADKKGVFETADGGTVFLDEVGNLSYDVQVQLLRVLQEFKIRPVGSSTDLDIDVRLVVATNEDLKKAIAEGRFREDLYHRLNEFAITVPPLRERTEDIPHFTTCFIEQANTELEKQVEGCSPEAMKMLKQYTWSGNLRELKNVIRRAVLFARTAWITPECLPDFLNAPPTPTQSDTPQLHQITDEKERILKALEHCHGNKAAAARLLQIDRKTLYNKMHQFGMALDATE